jgi:hypothetical protein
VIGVMDQLGSGLAVTDGRGQHIDYQLGALTTATAKLTTRRLKASSTMAR